MVELPYGRRLQRLSNLNRFEPQMFCQVQYRFSRVIYFKKSQDQVILRPRRVLVLSTTSS